MNWDHSSIAHSRPTVAGKHKWMKEFEKASGLFQTKLRMKEFEHTRGLPQPVAVTITTQNNGALGSNPGFSFLTFFWGCVYAQSQIRPTMSQQAPYWLKIALIRLGYQQRHLLPLLLPRLHVWVKTLRRPGGFVKLEFGQY